MGRLSGAYGARAKPVADLAPQRSGAAAVDVECLWSKAMQLCAGSGAAVYGRVFKCVRCSGFDAWQLGVARHVPALYLFG